MKRYLVSLPLSAAVVWAQEASPGAVEAEKALRERVQQFYQLQVDKKYRQSEAFVADDTVDQYLSAGKGNLLGFSIVKVELSDGNTRAKVTITVKATMTMMGQGRLPIETIAVTSWRIENGQWVWYIDQTPGAQGPFGAWRPSQGSADAHPDLASMRQKVEAAAHVQDQVRVDRSSVSLDAANPVQTVTISNALPGNVKLTLNAALRGISVQLDRSQLGAGETARVRVERIGADAVGGLIQVEVSPLNTRLDIRVLSN